MRAALWDRKTQLSITNPEASSWAFIVNETNSSEQTSLVDALSIQDLMEQYKLPMIDILKLDIEGAEKQVFFWLHRMARKRKSPHC